MAYDYFWSQVKKNSNIGNTHKTLADAYSLIREDNVALYTKSIGSDTEAPEPPIGTETLAVVPKEEVSKIRNMSKARQAGPVVTQLLSSCGIESVYHSICKKTIAGAAEDSGYDHVFDLLTLALEKKQEGGIVSLPLGDFNLLSILSAAVRRENPGLITAGFKEFILSIIESTPKYASTNVGPGEFACILFTNAKAAVGAGDIEIDNRHIEVKSSGARFGGGSDGTANHAADNITSYLSSKKFNLERSELLEDEKNNLISEITGVIDQAYQNKQFGLPELLNSITSTINNSRYHSIAVAKIWKKGVLGSLKGIVDDITNPENNSGEFFKPGTPSPTLLSPVNPAGKFQPSDNRKTTTLTYAQFLQQKLQEEAARFLSRKNTGKNVLSDEIDKQERNLSYLLKDAFNAIKKDAQNVITLQDLINIILYTNSYSVKELAKYGYDIIDDLVSYLGNLSVEAILNMSIGTLNDLIGGLHLISYAKAGHFNELFLLNKKTTESLILSAPENLATAVQYCKSPRITVDPSVDTAGSGTIYASTAAYSLD